MELFITVMIIGIIPGLIAQKKGRPFFLWWMYGMLLFIIALPHSLIIKTDLQTVEDQQKAEGLKKCPYCAEMIKPDAKVCRYCKREL